MPIMPSNEGAGSSAPAVRAGAPYKVLIVGASYAGLAATANLLDLCHARQPRFGYGVTPEDSPKEKVPVQVTIVDERDGYYHLIGSPLAFASEEYAAKTWNNYADIPALQTPEVNRIQGSVTTVDCARKISTIRETGTNREIQESYDYLIASSGLRRSWPSAPQSLNKEDYLDEVRMQVKLTKNVDNGVIVIGGGAVGIEMAAELKVVHPETKVTLVHSRPKLMSSEPLPDEFRDVTLSLLHEVGVETVMGSRVAQMQKIDGGRGMTLTLQNGTSLEAGHVINAVSKFTPTASYLPDVLVNKEGYVRIKPSLNFPDDVPNAQYHYAAGDIVEWSGIKRAGRAMHQGYYAAFNIHQRILNQVFGTTPKFLELEEVPPMMGIAVGKKAAAFGGEEGVLAGEDIMEAYFNDDLGFKICWNYMQLGEPAKV
ncbi:hypothetical protein AJ80_04000 [Polytolypa hystricis UAMH7299]|uniref:FAD/NAD(P)-binding domain-containing protein n=1 Tax=Polytolypa hystricis (strain UAMH7299) TaxID=1447883 RepID=A0A2B7YDU4_POLH7|nr:hypothetical protein AJ80_04000 [Polytolypa hystricis UAMH7299]